MHGLRVLSFERLLFSSDTVAVATHRLAGDDPLFEGYGPTSAFLVVFPRNSTLLEYAGCGGARDDRFVASPAVAPLYNRGQEYRRRQISAEGDFCDWFAIAPEVVREVVARFDPASADSERPLRFTHAAVAPRDYLEQRTVVDALGKDGGTDALFVEESILGVLGRLLGRAYAQHVTPPSRGQKELAREAAAVLERTFTENLPLTRIAAEVETSPFHLARSFRKAMGVTMHQHRLLLRLHASLALLRDTDRDVSTIALELGFGDHSHFTMTFRRRFGVTPSRYRARASSS